MSRNCCGARTIRVLSGLFGNDGALGGRSPAQGMGAHQIRVVAAQGRVGSERRAGRVGVDGGFTWRLQGNSGGSKRTFLGGYRLFYVGNDAHEGKEL